MEQLIIMRGNVKFITSELIDWKYSLIKLIFSEMCNRVLTIFAFWYFAPFI